MVFSLPLPVLIVGAGPTGLMLACQLAMRRVPFRIIDAKAGPTDLSKALVIQARTLEIFEQMGLETAIREQGHAATGINFMVRGQWVQNMNWQGIGEGKTAYPFMYILEQSKTERLLLHFLQQYHLEVEWHTELVHLTQTENNAQARVRFKDVAEEEITACWVVGADGARSFVRQQLDIPFIGGTYGHTFVVADTELTWPYHHEELFVCLSDKRLAAFFPMPGPTHFRVVSILSPEYRQQETNSFGPIARDLEKKLGIPLKFNQTHWFSTYKLHHRYAKNFRIGRCFLAGDAAHVHSPIGGQGLNTGLQDAYNLGWKLALVVQEAAGPDLLQTYQPERLPIARRLVNSTDRFFSLLVSKNLVLYYFRRFAWPLVLKKVLRYNKLKAALFDWIAQIGISYRKSSLSVTDAEGKHFTKQTLQPGDRVPYLLIFSANHNMQISLHSLLRNPYFTLLIFKSTFSTDRAESLQEELEAGLYAYTPDLIKSHIIYPHPDNHAAYGVFGITEDAFYLIRPDNYIGFRCQPANVESLFRYLDNALSLQPE